MTKLISALIAAVFAAATITPVAFAAEETKEPAKTEKKATKKAAKKDDVKKEEAKKEEAKK
jgi:pentapeptide MXKDX repeat protein